MSRQPQNRVDRRGFLTGAVTTALAGRAALAAPPSPGRPVTAAAPKGEADLSTWEGVRSEFLLGRDYVHMALMLLASHPRPVRDAIERHRRALDENPVVYGMKNLETLDRETRVAAGEYLGAQPDEIALTDSTTAGLALVYGGLLLRPRQEVLTTTHDHYSTHEALRLRALRSAGTVRKISLYATPEKATADEIVSNLIKGVGPRTRVVAVTWVHSSSGVKLPIRRMADALGDINRKRAEADRVLFCVDGVHAFGVEAETVGDLGCDFLIAGCHKWLFGPRGTGIVWGRPAAWKNHAATVPCFEWAALKSWMHDKQPTGVGPGLLATPGGFHSFEHRWALAEAFKFHMKLGRARVAARIHELATHCKQGLAAIPKVKLRTPMSPELSAGITCFEIDGMHPEAIVERLREHKIIASDSPYAVSYARLTPGLLNTPDEVDRAVAAVKAIAG